MEQRLVGQELYSLDPHWIARIYKKTTGEDFLGLRAVQANITDYLLPGITTITPRARYYPFYCWLLVEYGDSHPRGMLLREFIKRREQIFVLANLAWSAGSDDNPHEVGLLGSDALGRHWKEYHEANVIPLSKDDYLAASHGGYNQYSGVLRTLGLTRVGASGGIDILPKGQELARTFSKTIRDTRYCEQRTAFDTAPSIPCAFLQEYGERCHLSGLAASSDGPPTLEHLFAFDVEKILPPPNDGDPSIGNMKGTLGLILDMLNQAQAPFSDDDFRRTAAYGLCVDYEPYRPSKPLHPFLAHWQMFQLREYYVYALYALWVYFLRWLRPEGPQTFQAFCAHLSEAIDLMASAAEIGLAIPARSSDEWTLTEWLNTLLDASNIPGDDLKSRCVAFAKQSKALLNEHALYQLLHRTRRNVSSLYAGVAWLLLSTLFLRLHGLQDSDRWNAWYWAKFGGARRRSMDLFVRDIDNHRAAGNSLLDTWSWLYRDYIVAQHIITALEKWRQRNANTFHFNYDRGAFERVRDDRTGFSSSRFRQAYDMLADLGLYEIVAEAGDRPRLTKLGQQTLGRVLEACNG
jgi:hypothetical protein